ncbi:hypothetical protein GCM10010168_27830 [Actinoplanes ianthinogenes]|uniref:Uncharacterized protein n=1 Tax=Actinoplanes ianthinogenes TaxID=122358 RepID=A0ABM7LL33_9ACTN|nr:hypothetical protein [Actinoplanes ianthinogenes]BCJ39924.1 hypothetical protein Aiant_05810 [Actinoplanes ianthinogenes]GGR09048.1 hypothetical protein GCM10010168_27830 [Actinoplanes ianthinogenes]
MSAPKWIRVYAGPVLVSLVLVGAVAGAVYLPSDKDAAKADGCRADPAAIRAIRAEQILTQNPRLTRMDEAVEGLTCGSPSSFGSVSRRLTKPPTDTGSGAEVARYYAQLAQRSGWKPFEYSNYLYSATKETGGCPWWFLLRAEGDAYQLRVMYQPAGVPASDCAWAVDEPIFLQATIPIGK